MTDSASRQTTISDTLVGAFETLMTSDPRAFRTKFRKMAADPFAFYRGTTPLFYADMAALDDPWADERTSRVWIHGDLHAENFGTYMDSNGRLTFDVNDFDEAYLGHFSWDLRRFVTSLALLCWRKALPEKTIRQLISTYLSSYLDQVDHYAAVGRHDFALQLHNTEGAIHDVLQSAQTGRRTELLDSLTLVENGKRHFRDDDKNRRLGDEERAEVERAFTDYLTTIPEPQKSRRETYYVIKDIVGRSGFGIGSAGLPAYNILIDGFNEALENDIVLALKQGNVAAPSRVVTDPNIRDAFGDDGRRTVITQRGLQDNTDPLLGHTVIHGSGFVVHELSPYQADLSWDNLTEPDEIDPVLTDLGRATAKVHCSSDPDSDQSLVPFRTEQAISAVIGDRRQEFIDEITEFAIEYSATVRRDRALFVEAFRENRIPGVPST